MQLYWDVASMPKLITDVLAPRLVELGLIASTLDVHQAVLNIYHKVKHINSIPVSAGLTHRSCAD